MYLYIYIGNNHQACTAEAFAIKSVLALMKVANLKPPRLIRSIPSMLALCDAPRSASAIGDEQGGPAGYQAARYSVEVESLDDSFRKIQSLRMEIETQA